DRDRLLVAGGLGRRAHAEREQSGALQQRLQPRVAAEGEARAATRELGREAQEEEHVADALLGLEAKRPSGERCWKARRIRRGRGGRQSLRREPPAVFAPRLGEIAAREQRAREVLVRDSERRVRSDGLAIRVDGLVEAA